MNQREQVRGFFDRTLQHLGDRDPWGDNTSLVLSGRLSSLDVVGILTFLETTFDFVMDPNQFDQAHFDSVDSIMEMLEEQPV